MITELVVYMYGYDYESMSLTTLFYSGSCLQARRRTMANSDHLVTITVTPMASNQRETFIKSFPFSYNLSGGKNIWA